MARSVEGGRQVRLSHRHPDSHAESLPERSGRDVDSGRNAKFGVSWRLALPLAELLEIFEAEVISGEVEKAVEQHRAVTGGKDKAITIRPLWVAGIEFQESGPEHIGHAGRAHWQARMA